MKIVIDAMGGDNAPDEIIKISKNIFQLFLEYIFLLYYTISVLRYAGGQWSLEPEIHYSRAYVLLEGYQFSFIAFKRC